MAEPEITYPEAPERSPVYGETGQPSKTGASATLEAKLDALLVLNGVDPLEIEEAGIEAVKSRMGQLSGRS